MTAARRSIGVARETVEDGEWRPRPGARTSILFDVFALSQQVRQLLQVAMRDAGMRADEYAVYSVVFEEGPLTLTALAQRTGMPVTTAADYVRAMRARGHLNKERHPADSRAYLLALTPAGTAAHRTANASFEVADAAFVRDLAPADEASARDVLQRLTDRAARATATVAAPGPGSSEEAPPIDQGLVHVDRRSNSVYKSSIGGADLDRRGGREG